MTGRRYLFFFIYSKENNTVATAGIIGFTFSTELPQKVFTIAVFRSDLYLFLHDLHFRTFLGSIFSPIRFTCFHFVCTRRCCYL